MLTEISVIITSVATVIYTIGTFLLWNVTKNTLILTKNSIAKSDQRIKSQIYSDIVTSHRDIYLKIIANPRFADFFIQEGRSIKDVEAAYIASIIINHLSQIYYHLMNKDFDKSLEYAIINDIQDIFKMPFINVTWMKIKDMHDKNFIKFIDNLIINKI